MTLSDWAQERAVLTERLQATTDPERCRRLIQAIGHRWSQRRWRARFHHHGAIGFPPEAPLVRLVARWAVHPNAALRQTALHALEYAGAFAAIAQPVVLRGLLDPEPLVRLAAAGAAARLRLSAGAAPVLREALTDDIWTVRWHAAGSLARLGEEHGLAQVLVDSCPAAGYHPDWLDAVVQLARPSGALAAAFARADK